MLTLWAALASNNSTAPSIDVPALPVTAAVLEVETEHPDKANAKTAAVAETAFAFLRIFLRNEFLAMMESLQWGGGSGRERDGGAA